MFFFKFRKHLFQKFSKINPIIRYVNTNNTNKTYQYEYGPEIQTQMNKQIMNELFASHSYLSMATYFARNNIALGGCSGRKITNMVSRKSVLNSVKIGFFLRLSDEEKGHAHKLINYQNTRGGIVELNEILTPKKCDWISLSETLNDAICLERTITESLLELYQIAEQFNDLMLMDFITKEFLHEQV